MKTAKWDKLGCIQIRASALRTGKEHMELFMPLYAYRIKQDSFFFPIVLTSNSSKECPKQSESHSRKLLFAAR